MHISLIVLCTGLASSLARLPLCIEGIKAQTMPPDEIIFAADSKGATEDAALEKLLRPFLKDSKATTALSLLPTTSADFRAAQARNAGAKLTTGDILIFLDCDCVPDPDFVSEHALSHLEWFAAIEANQYAASRHSYGFRRHKEIDDPTPNAEAEMEKRLLASRFATPSPDRAYGFSVSLPARVFVALGGWDETLDGAWGGSEDIDLAERHHRYGGVLHPLLDGGYVTHIDHERLPARDDALLVVREILSGTRPLIANLAPKLAEETAAVAHEPASEPDDPTA